MKILPIFSGTKVGLLHQLDVYLAQVGKGLLEVLDEHVLLAGLP